MARRKRKAQKRKAPVVRYEDAIVPSSETEDEHDSDEEIPQQALSVNLAEVRERLSTKRPKRPKLDGIPRAVMDAFVHEYFEEIRHDQELQIDDRAVAALRDAADLYLVTLFEDCAILMMYKNRQTVSNAEFDALKKLKNSTVEAQNKLVGPPNQE